MAFVPIYFLPQDVGTGRFMKMLLWLHGALFLVLTNPPASGEDVASRSRGVSPSFLNTVFIALAGVIHIPATLRLITSIPTGQSFTSYLYITLFSHPAQASISSTSSGYSSSFPAGQFSPVHLFRFLKSTFFLSGLGLALVNYTGINWGLVASIVPMLLLLSLVDVRCISTASAKPTL